jgi:hypothetical protein
MLGAEDVDELAWIRNNLHTFNGRSIKNEAQEVMVREVNSQEGRQRRGETTRERFSKSVGRSVEAYILHVSHCWRWKGIPPTCSYCWPVRW